MGSSLNLWLAAPCSPHNPTPTPSSAVQPLSTAAREPPSPKVIPPTALMVENPWPSSARPAVKWDRPSMLRMFPVATLTS